ncbi:UNVERIFIED_CONTAM: hypothetical protein PYX00_000792 [Menopon gallinae]|uniref:Major facilitator superfamily domain-containing protein 12-like n=1 Tax=Menopon gallinae TaxID=328185 RepID=A0AAW2IAL6_9NEOP
MGVRSDSSEGPSEDTLLLLGSNMCGESGQKEEVEEKLKFSQKLAYGVGHVLNDNSAAVWFSYTLLYFQVVMGMPQVLTGSLLLVGQVMDAVATPVVGIFADRTGRRKLWHLAGTLMTVVSFPLVFMGWPPYPYSGEKTNSTNPSDHNASESDSSLVAWMVGVYYVLLIVIFQIGWAVVQIAHLALIPMMTPLQTERAELTAIRFSASICSSIFMYLVTWFILLVTHNRTTRDAASARKSTLGPNDAFKFRDVVLIGLSIGALFSAWFHIVLRVPDDVHTTDKPKQDSAAMKSGIKKYLTSMMLYQVSILYVSSRLFLTLSLVYMPLYLVENAGEEAEYLATVPLVSYIASFATSVIVRQIHPCLGSKFVYLVGAIVSILGCIWIGVGLGRLSLSGELFSVAVLFGVGNSVTMVSSLCLTANFIGEKTEQAAFVYSVVTFADKLLNGIVVMIIEQLKCQDCNHYYQDVLAYACGATVLIGIVALLSMQVFNFSLTRLKECVVNFKVPCTK